MSVTYYLWAIGTWVIMGFVGGMIDGVFFGGDDLNVVVNLQVIQFKEFLSIPMPVPNLDFFSSLGNLAIWNLSVFNNTFGDIVRLLIGIPIMGSLIYAVMKDMLPILISSVQAIANLVDAVNPFS